MKKYYCFFLLVFTFQLANAQQSLKEQADRFFENMAYSAAIPIYKKSLEKKFNSSSVQKLAECYRLTNNYDEAAKWYGKVIELDEKPPISVFYYGEALLQQGDYKNAKKWFLEYADLVPEDPRGIKFAKGIDDIPALLDNPNNFTIENCEFNSKNSDFGLARYKDHLIFASSRKGSFVGKEFKWTEDNFLNLYYVPTEPSTWSNEGEILPMGGDLNTKFHESNFTGAKGNNKVYFNRNNFIQGKKGKSDEGVVLLKIYSGEFNEFNITEIEDFQYNSDDYSCFHPALSEKGRFLYFVSDMPGGNGGTDIYVCKKQGAYWSKPTNLGKDINTPGDELFPFIHPDGSLFFASNGHPGLGHLDIFKVNLENSSKKPENLGAPVNSPYDDFSLYMSEDKSVGFFSSNRPGGAGDDDIYRFEDNRPKIQILVRNKETLEPITDAEINLTNRDDESELFYTTNDQGVIKFNTEYDLFYTATVKTDEYDNVVEKVNTEYEEGKKIYKYVIDLFNPPGFSLLVIDRESNEPIPHARLRLMDLINGGKPSYLLADANGKAFVVTEDEAKFNVQVDEPDYLHYDGIFGKSEKGYYGDTIIPITKIEIDKAIVLKNIRYDFDQHFIRDDAKPDLISVATMMRDNPGLEVQLSSHTDSRGSDAYNMKLSQRRANAAVGFIVSLGIDKSRITAVGFGESKLLNECSNGIACSEDKHFMNRRTEFKIVGVIEGVNMERSSLDTEKMEVEVKSYLPQTQ